MQSVDMKKYIVEMGEFEIGRRGHSVSSDLKLTFVTRNRLNHQTLGNALLDGNNNTLLLWRCDVSGIAPPPEPAYFGGGGEMGFGL